ncbi:MAG TPA: acetyl-CoA acetyltransferase [Acidimicrobiia bacterium]|nr:acetyl-CoA acetyltransferase [Acidimicrobiia bacterium]
MQRKVCVVGVGLSDGPVTPNLSATMLEAQSFKRALDDAGLNKNEIDGLASAGYGGMHEVMLAEYLGVRPTWMESTSVGGSSFEFHTKHAYRAIQNGDADTIAIVYGNNQLSASGRTLGTGGGGRGRGGGMAMPLGMSYEFPTGLTLVGSYAMAAQRHMYQYGTKPEHLASIAVQTREHATRNPRAMYRDPITVDDVLQSKLVADPLHKLDCCVISDGGCCIILTTEDRARSLAHRPVFVRGAAGGSTHHSINAMTDMTRTAAAISGPKAFKEAGITPADVDMFAMYDSFTYTVLVVLEDLGFAPKGEGGPFVVDNGGNLRLGGALPTNTDGGGLSCTHPGMRGLFLLCEATRQLRGEAGDSQVAGAEIAVAHGSGGWLSTQGTVVLGTEGV